MMGDKRNWFVGLLVFVAMVAIAFWFSGCKEGPPNVHADVEMFVKGLSQPMMHYGTEVPVPTLDIVEFGRVARACDEAGVYAEFWHVLDYIQWASNTQGWNEAATEFRVPVRIPGNTPAGKDTSYIRGMPLDYIQRKATVDAAKGD